MKTTKTFKVAKSIISALLIINCQLLIINCVAQGGASINTTGTAAHNSAMLDVSSTTQGQLLPRMSSAQMNVITSPATGLVIYNTDCNTLSYYNGTFWVAIGNTGIVSAPGVITGNTAPCQNATGVAYSIAPVSGATAYNWTLPTGATLATGQGTTSITVNFGISNGNVCVTAISSCGSSNANCTAITFLPVPSAAGTISGTIPVCQSQNGVSYSISSISGATGYVWAYTGNGFSVATGSNTNSITADYSVTATSGNLSVYGTNVCGNGSASSTYAVTVNSPPTTASAGNDINPVCGVTTATLAGNTPSVGTGSWSVVSGTATITTPSSPTSGITGLAVPDTATLRWTISNSPCTASADDVVITTISCCNITGTGGTITSSGGRTIHTFTSSETFAVTCGGGNVQVLVIGGGGGGGYTGGGGAGGYQYNASFPVTIQSYTVIVGGGGNGSQQLGSNGNNSVFSTITALGGGGGSHTEAGNNGGSGGGSSGTLAGGIGSQGNNGGSGHWGTTWDGGGGGGAGSAGTSGTSNNGGHGGNGLANSISGSSVTYAGGGGGAGTNGQSAGVAGTGGGGNSGAVSSGNGYAGTANTGGGGGSSGANSGLSGGPGGSGIVIISYLP
ncbi:MAG: hypothetical protein HGB12_02425 [Bacteroidetes bacterium]|nr:hypothetical protein [Bacteroidota bacterium]